MLVTLQVVIETVLRQPILNNLLHTNFGSLYSPHPSLERSPTIFRLRPMFPPEYPKRSTARGTILLNRIIKTIAHDSPSDNISTESRFAQPYPQFQSIINRNNGNVCFQQSWIKSSKIFSPKSNTIIILVPTVGILRTSKWKPNSRITQFSYL